MCVRGCVCVCVWREVLCVCYVLQVWLSFFFYEQFLSRPLSKSIKGPTQCEYVCVCVCVCTPAAQKRV